MGERTEHPQGTFSWLDLSTDDHEGAKRFYSELFGWEIEDMPAGDDMTYSMARIDGKDVAAVFKGDGTLPVHWNSYVTVDDLDAWPEKVKAAGGEVMAEPFDVMDAGRMAVIQDPTGAFLNLWEAKENIGAGLVNVPGALTWNDLNTSDPEKAMEFYGELFGWDFQKVPDDATEYWVIMNGGRSNGGVRPIDNSQPGEVPAHWLPYFACSDVEEARAKVEALGGRTFFGPMQVPQGSFAVVGDPQGGAFALFSGEFDD